MCQLGVQIPCEGTILRMMTSGFSARRPAPFPVALTSEFPRMLSTSVPIACKDCWTDRHAVYVVDRGEPKEPCIKCGSRSPCEWAILRREGRHVRKYRDSLPWAVQKRLNRSGWSLGCGLLWVQGACIIDGGAHWRNLPGEYDWTVHVRRRCGL